MVRRAPVAGKLEWVEARTDKYEELKDFYGNILGLALKFEEERKDFLQYRVGSSKTYLAILNTKRTGMAKAQGFVPTFEVPDLTRFIGQMKRRGVKVGTQIIEGEHVMLVDFCDPNGNTLQAFQWKRKTRD